MVTAVTCSCCSQSQNSRSCCVVLLLLLAVHFRSTKCQATYGTIFGADLRGSEYWSSAGIVPFFINQQQDFDANFRTLFDNTGESSCTLRVAGDKHFSPLARH